MKDNHLENPNTDEDRQERVQQKKKSKAGKAFLILLGFIVVAVVVFLTTIKLVQPDFKVSQLIPEGVSQSVDEKILGKTTTTEPTTPAPTTTTTTTAAPEQVDASYLPIEEFALKNGDKGNDMGNILNGGKAGTDAYYIYHIVDGRGIYRFEPNNESYARIYQSEHKLTSLNLKGDYVYFVDSNDSVLYRMKKGSGKADKLAKDVKTAYVYGTRIVYITTDNSVKAMNTEKLKPRELYSSSDDIELIGISLNSVFFSVKDVDGRVSYKTVDFKKKTGVRNFREQTYGDELVSPMLENGFLYYFEKNDGDAYNLCRQKYGSQNVITLIKNVTCINPVIVHDNRLFYGEIDEKGFKMMELNMNSDAVKTMLSVKKATNENTLICQHAGEYDFIIGAKNAGGDKVYCASSFYTGSENVMKFKEGKWSY